MKGIPPTTIYSTTSGNMPTEDLEQVPSSDGIAKENEAKQSVIAGSDKDRNLPVSKNADQILLSPSSGLEELEHEIELQRQLVEKTLETHIIDRSTGEILNESTKSLAAVEEELLLQQKVVEKALGTIAIESQRKIDSLSSTNNEMRESESEFTVDSAYIEEKKDETVASTSLGGILLTGSWQEATSIADIGEAICGVSSMVSADNGCCISGQEALDSVLDEQNWFLPAATEKISAQEDQEREDSNNSTPTPDEASPVSTTDDIVKPNRHASPTSKTCETLNASTSTPNIESSKTQKVPDTLISNSSTEPPAMEKNSNSKGGSTKQRSVSEREVDTPSPSEQTVHDNEDELSVEENTILPSDAAFEGKSAIYVKDDDFGWVPAFLLECKVKTAIVCIALDQDWRKSTVGRFRIKKKRSNKQGDKSKPSKLKKKELERIVETYKVPAKAVRAVPWKEYKDGVLPVQNPEVSKGDLVDLVHLHEASILFNLKERHYKSMPYTRVGDIMIAMNPYVWIDDLYTTDTQEEYTNSLIWKGKKDS